MKGKLIMKAKSNGKRISFMMDVDLLIRVDEYAKKMGITRSGAICILCSSALDSQQSLGTMEELLKAIKDVK